MSGSEAVKTILVMAVASVAVRLVMARYKSTVYLWS